MTIGALSRGAVSRLLWSTISSVGHLDGTDWLSNLRSLCRDHDQRVKERPSGQLANAGKLFAKGCLLDGSPRDPRGGGVRS